MIVKTLIHGSEHTRTCRGRVVGFCCSCCQPRHTPAWTVVDAEIVRICILSPVWNLSSCTTPALTLALHQRRTGVGSCGDGRYSRYSRYNRCTYLFRSIAQSLCASTLASLPCVTSSYLLHSVPRLGGARVVTEMQGQHNT